MNVHFEPGDKVRLLDGGPAMVVRGQHYDVNTNNYMADVVDCIWYIETASGKREVRYRPCQIDDIVKVNAR